ncbi:mechanosensitive ion channel family protein [Phyllobacterium bourgognense]|uniref:Small-conductance mechanosensitive channel n=1 Tax=Phyllobacterium bourgognense TaxID=314236 RepID=A0A368YD18_9HYPH|nr:mechanosensitive ion channel family protein [Phyllobacterium bourgognense]RCW78141.1 small-conductance mechanosensitive channel [Phyllobacterium bourgognense]
MHIAPIRKLAGKVSVLLTLCLVLLCAVVSASPAQKANETPPPGKVDQLLKLMADPDVKAWIATKGASSFAAEEPAVPTANDVMGWSNTIRAHLRGLGQAVPAVPAEFSQARSTIMTEINGRRPGAILVLFAAFAGLGFGAEFACRRILGRAHRQMAAPSTIEGSHARHHVIGRSVFTAIAPLVVFAFASVGAFHAFTWPPLLAMLVLPMLVALIAWRVIMQITAILLGTDRSRVNDSSEVPARLIPMDDAAAAFWYRRVAYFAGIFFTGWTAAALMTALNFSPNVKSLIIYVLGLGLLAVALETVWNRPEAPIASRAYRVKEWLLTLYLCLLWLLWVAGTSGALWVGIYVLILPPILRTTSTIVKSFFSGPDDTTAKPRNPVFEVLIERGARVVIIALAAAWLAAVIRLRASGLMEDEAASRMIRGVLGGIVVLLAADLIWHMAKGLINQRIERARTEGGDEAALARSGRLMTLLPILRNFLAVLIAVLAVLMVLSGLGVAIGPLIAGAGIFGVAIGFGSQSLVRDIISGIFYMTDDAFRVGEYIKSGTYMGTVESFGIRSVKLRHHRGPIFTVPFGTLGAVQNMSRDWVIDKFLISVNFDADLVKVKKLVKGVGAELLEDEELGPYIIETVKMKGVEAFSDYGINLSFAVMTKPGHQSSIRRRAYAMIREAFALNGIGFASPTVQVAGGEDHAAGAVAAASDTITRKKAAEAKLKLVEGES